MSDTMFHPLVAQIAQEFSWEAEQLFLSAESLTSYVGDVRRLDGGERNIVMEHLAVLAMRCRKLAPDHTRIAMVQLAALIAVASNRTREAQALINAAARALIGSTSSNKPVGAAGRPAGSMSPLGARFLG
jgi:hypothetical protein